MIALNYNQIVAKYSLPAELGLNPPNVEDYMLNGFAKYNGYFIVKTNNDEFTFYYEKNPTLRIVNNYYKTAQAAMDKIHSISTMMERVSNKQAFINDMLEKAQPIIDEIENNPENEAFINANKEYLHIILCEIIAVGINPNADSYYQHYQYQHGIEQVDSLVSTIKHIIKLPSIDLFCLPEQTESF